MSFSRLARPTYLTRQNPGPKSRLISRLIPGLVFSLALGLMSVSSALAAEPVAQHNTNAFWFENWGDLSNAQLKVSLPGGKISSVQAPVGTPVFQLTGTDIQDGVYAYELTAATSEQVEIVNPINNGRGDNAASSAAKPFYMTGVFHVQRGVIVTPETKTEDGD